MQQWNRTVAGKVICFILCIVFLAVTAASITGAALMISAELYTLPKEYVIDASNYRMLHSAGNNIIMMHLDGDGYHYYSNYDYSPDITNIRYQVVSPDGEIVGSNTEKSDFKYSFDYVLYKDEHGNYTELDYVYDSDPIENGDIYTVKMALADGLPANDEYSFYNSVFNIAYSLLYWIYPIGLAGLFGSVCCFIILMCSSARKKGSDELHPGVLFRVPLDVFLCLLAVIFVLCLFLIWEVWYTGELLGAVLTGLLIFIYVNIFIGMCMSIAARIKSGTIFKNNILWIILRSIGRFFKIIGKGTVGLIRAVPIIPKTVIFTLINLSLDLFFLILAFNWEEIAFVFWAIKTACILPLFLYAALMMRRLEKGGRAIADGDLSFRVDTHRMLWNFKSHGECLNSISNGMGRAVEERLQSERMKTELITNVSHDIKTPITSIINYSSLISENDCNCEKHREYSEVLIRKSEHLKRLLDDLVEISKATTGNLEVNLTPCDAGVLLTQAAGEFEERCSQASLELICSSSNSPLMILADSRRIWRVLENLMTNACKYSLPGSRVYLSLEKRRDTAVFTLRNTSKEPLNISPEELTHRFVRGDSSRSTEGSGLGLSIAKSLTELQGGTMDITIDGDLFKVTLTFSLIE